MRTRGLNSGKLLPLIVILLTLLHVGVSSASGGKAEKSIESRYKKAVAPVRAKDVAPEIWVLTTCLDPEETDTFQVYLDKFVVWTMDTSAVFKAIGNPDYIKGVRHYPGWSYEVKVNTGDPKIGKRLRDRLRKLPFVDRVENHLYSQPLELGVLPWVYLRLYNESDSVRLKEFADSLNLKISSTPRFEYIKWELEIGPGNKLYPRELVKKVLATGMAQYCGINWDHLSDITLFTYDPYIEHQWGLYNRKNPTRPDANRYTDLDISRAWDYSTGKDITICVIDLGFDLANRDLKNNLKSCYDASTGKDTVIISHSHGTACADIACGIRNNNFGISGVAPDAKLMAIAIKNEPATIDKRRISTFSQIYNAFKWATDHGADIISCSWTFSENKEIRDGINYALLNGRGGKGCIVVAAAGNDGDKGGQITFPATVDKVLAIGAVNELLLRAPFSCYGDKLFAVAPGVDIIVPDSQNQYEPKQGTSYACPAVAGVAALILEVAPDATVDLVHRILRETSHLPDGELPDSNPASPKFGDWNSEYGYGLVNAFDAVKRAILLAKNNGKSGWIADEMPYPDIDSDAIQSK